MLRRIALLSIMLMLSACASPAPAAPTPAPAPPTAAPPAKPTAVAPSPAAVASPSPSPVAAPSPAAAAAPSPSPSPVAAPPVGSSRVEVLNSANAAFSSGDLATASSLYDRVLNTPPTAEPQDEQSAIDQFAGFRAVVSLLATGKEDQAKAHLDAMQKADPNAPFARLGNQLWEQYSMVGGVRGACSQLQPQMASQAGPTLQTLQGVGVSVDAADVCKVPN